MNCAKYLRIPFLQETSGQLLLIFKPIILNKFVHSVNIVGTLHLMKGNVDFVFYDP